MTKQESLVVAACYHSAFSRSIVVVTVMLMVEGKSCEVHLFHDLA